MSLIVIKQLPEIEQNLHTLSGQIAATVATALELEVTEDNCKAVKKNLADMRKGIKVLEDQRLDVRRRILAPYEAMEAVYRECVTDIWKPAEAALSQRIVQFEDGLKERKRIEVQEYFGELCVARGIDFINLDETGVNVTLSASLKSLKSLVFGYIEMVSEALETIKLQEDNAEILVEFKRSRNLAQAISVVARRHEAIAEEQRRAAGAAQAEAQRSAIIAKVEEAAAEDKSMLAPPTALPWAEEDARSPAEEPVLRYTLRLTGPGGESCDITVSAPKSHMVTYRKILKWKEIPYECITKPE